MDAWNDWYHVSGCTYAAWLPGDPRGWRSRNHKEHVEGDYKKPPPAGSYAGLHDHACRQLTRPPVHLKPEYRRIAGQAMVEMFFDQKIEIIVLALTAIHFHLLAKFPNKQVRPLVGRSKTHAHYILRDYGHAGRVWAHECGVTPIAERRHQVNVFEYICRHTREGAWLWTFREGLYWPTTIHRK